MVFVETKWRSNASTPFGGSTLRRVIDPLADTARLLVIVNARDVSRAESTLGDAARRRIRIQPWLDSGDDPELAQALRDLLTDYLDVESSWTSFEVTREIVPLAVE